MSNLSTGFDPNKFMPHGMCFNWQPDLLWTRVISDGAIFLAYAIIPMLLIYIVKKRGDIQFSGMFYLFGAFILFCGLTHAVGIYVLWVPDYYLDGAMRAATAIVSVTTAFALWKLAPVIVNLPSPTKYQKAVRALDEEQDISSTLKHELRETTEDFENRKAMIFEAASDAILVVDEELKIVEANTAAIEFFSWDLKEKSASLNELFESEVVTAIFEKGDSVNRIVTHAIDRVKLENIPLEITVNSGASRGNNLTVLFIRDISDRVKSERLKSEFVSIVSHELRTPLTAISGSADLLLAGIVKSPEEQQNMLQILVRNCRRLIGLVNDLLDFGKIDNGHLNLQLCTFDAVNMLKEIASQFQLQASEKRVKIEIRIIDNEVLVNADRSRISQVVTNLVGNALKFSPEDSQITVTCRKVEEVCRFEISDEGPGIPIEEREKIFERFYQVDSGMRRKVGGTGLGLAISKEIVEKHSGFIGIADDIQAGTQFYFEVPLTAVIKAK